ncbi:hypothetical protein [Pseudomonas rhizoryzae]|uniref:hypothetical protein n=1 Tax=Pseudomonas rhizoryzae TaxID=2571129 RepID=UPI000941A784|nr:hypothetical protein [Pseudomonas rhizoryzae]APQ10715.1 hypothetical protein BJP27_04040 [Pseudomonas psychrotolerans]
MHRDPRDQAREALLGLYRQLQDNASQLTKVDCDNRDIQDVLQAVQDLNQRVADLVAETALLAPLKLGPLAGSGSYDGTGQP